MQNCIQGAETEFAPPLLHSYFVKGVQIRFPHPVHMFDFNKI